MTLAGICATDLELIRSYKGGYRGILGHEFVGVVEAAPGQPAWVGRRVVGEINIGCGDCELCRSGLEQTLPDPPLRRHHQP
ncbi:MAG: alcohol dehydrogenase catalytic domain-containing protein [Caldilineaceae bacterium]